MNYPLASQHLKFLHLAEFVERGGEGSHFSEDKPSNSTSTKRTTFKASNELSNEAHDNRDSSGTDRATKPSRETETSEGTTDKRNTAEPISVEVDGNSLQTNQRVNPCLNTEISKSVDTGINAEAFDSPDTNGFASHIASNVAEYRHACQNQPSKYDVGDMSFRNFFIKKPISHKRKKQSLNEFHSNFLSSVLSRPNRSRKANVRYA